MLVGATAASPMGLLPIGGAGLYLKATGGTAAWKAVPVASAVGGGISAGTRFWDLIPITTNTYHIGSSTRSWMFIVLSQGTSIRVRGAAASASFVRASVLTTFVTLRTGDIMPGTANTKNIGQSGLAFQGIWCPKYYSSSTIFGCFTRGGSGAKVEYGSLYCGSTYAGMEQNYGVVRAKVAFASSGAAKGSLMVGSTTGVFSHLAVGASGLYLKSSGGTASWKAAALPTKIGQNLIPSLGSTYHIGTATQDWTFIVLSQGTSLRVKGGSVSGGLSLVRASNTATYAGLKAGRTIIYDDILAGTTSAGLGATTTAWPSIVLNTGQSIQLRGVGASCSFVRASVPTTPITLRTGTLVPMTTNARYLGSSALQWKGLFLASAATIAAKGTNTFDQAYVQIVRGSSLSTYGNVYLGRLSAQDAWTEDEFDGLTANTNMWTKSVTTNGTGAMGASAITYMRTGFYRLATTGTTASAVRLSNKLCASPNNNWWGAEFRVAIAPVTDSNQMTARFGLSRSVNGAGACFIYATTVASTTTNWKYVCYSTSTAIKTGPVSLGAASAAKAHKWRMVRVSNGTSVRVFKDNALLTTIANGMPASVACLWGPYFYIKRNATTAGKNRIMYVDYVKLWSTR